MLPGRGGYMRPRLFFSEAESRWRAMAKPAGELHLSCDSDMAASAGAGGPDGRRSWEGLCGTDMGSPFRRADPPPERAEFVNPFPAQTLPKFRRVLQCALHVILADFGRQITSLIRLFGDT